eukprot:403352718
MLSNRNRMICSDKLQGLLLVTKLNRVLGKLAISSNTLGEFMNDLYESVKKLKLTLARIADDKRENQQSPHIQNKKSNRASKNIETQMQFQDLSHCCQHPYFDLYGKTMLINHIQEQSNIDKTVNMQDITDWQVYESLRKRINEEYLTIFGTHAVKNLSVGSEDSTKCEVVSDSVETNQVLSSLFKSSFSQSMMDTPLSHSLNEVRHKIKLEKPIVIKNEYRSSLQSLQSLAIDEQIEYSYIEEDMSLCLNQLSPRYDNGIVDFEQFKPDREMIHSGQNSPRVRATSLLFEERKHEFDEQFEESKAQRRDEFKRIDFGKITDQKFEDGYQELFMPVIVTQSPNKIYYTSSSRKSRKTQSRRSTINRKTQNMVQSIREANHDSNLSSDSEDHQHNHMQHEYSALRQNQQSSMMPQSPSAHMFNSPTYPINSPQTYDDNICQNTPYEPTLNNIDILDLDKIDNDCDDDVIFLGDDQTYSHQIDNLLRSSEINYPKSGFSCVSGSSAMVDLSNLESKDEEDLEDFRQLLKRILCSMNIPPIAQETLLKIKRLISIRDLKNQLWAHITQETLDDETKQILIQDIFKEQLNNNHKLDEVSHQMAFVGLLHVVAEQGLTIEAGMSTDNEEELFIKKTI